MNGWEKPHTTEEIVDPVNKLIAHYTESKILKKKSSLGFSD